VLTADGRRQPARPIDTLGTPALRPPAGLAERISGLAGGAPIGGDPTPPAASSGGISSRGLKPSEDSTGQLGCRSWRQCG
jgi:hypothetical protein